ncbi:MAG TPA: tetratricopeptide repeat protein [Bryobacteraceae bacterium]|nr:tetratricopeptide repeat protein [Bryobacteraceae bacterium]
MSFRISASLAMGFVLAAAVLAQQPLTLEQIVQKHVDAIGGIEKIHALKSLVFRGMYHEGGEIPPGTPIVARNYSAFLRPYYQVIGDPAIANPDLREGFDGSAWEYYGDPGVTIRTVGAAAAATRHTAEFLHDSLVDYQEKGTKLELQGTEKIDGKECYKIFVTLSDGFQKYLFVDRESFLIAAGRGSAPIHAFGAAVTTEGRFLDYKPTNGVLFPRRVIEVELATGRILSDARNVTIEANTLTDPSIFSPAPRAKTPLQDILEKLYEERADAVSVMYSYRLFRRTHPDVDTREGIEFIGYQMAKTKDYPASIELLRANTEDYPNSASAQFGLGRALQASGDSAGAAKAFQQALKIDPQFKKATDGLNALR